MFSCIPEIAFATNTSMAFGTVNLLYGVPVDETPVTCTAGVATFVVEFGALSRLTGDPVFEQTALKAMDTLWNSRSSIGLVSSFCSLSSLWNSRSSIGLVSSVCPPLSLSFSLPLSLSPSLPLPLSPSPSPPLPLPLSPSPSLPLPPPPPLPLLQVSCIVLDSHQITYMYFVIPTNLYVYMFCVGDFHS